MASKKSKCKMAAKTGKTSQEKVSQPQVQVCMIDKEAAQAVHQAALPSWMAEALLSLKSIPKDLASATEDSNPFEIINSHVIGSAIFMALNIILPYFQQFARYQLEVRHGCLYKREGDQSLSLTVVPVVPDDKKAIYLAVSKNAFPKYTFPSPDDEWHFLTLRTPTGDVLNKEVTNEFKKMFEKQTFHDFLAKRKEINEVKPFPHFDPSVAGLLRPPVTNAVASTIREIPKGEDIVDDTTSELPSFLRYPYLISGESGSGKTVASLQLADKLEMRAVEYWKVKRPNDPKPVVLAIYDDTPLVSSKNVLVGVAEAIASSVESAWKKARLEVHIEKSLANVLIYVVLDEMGAYKDAVRELVRGYRGVFQAELSTALTKKGREFTLDPHHQGIPIVLSIVGTGVGYPDSYGSIGSAYNTAKVERDPYAIIDEPFKSSLKKDKLLKVLMTNFRCAAYLANRLPAFLLFSKDLSPVSLTLALMVTTDYIQSNAWRHKFQKGGDGEKYLSLLVSLKFTQEYNCHVLTDAELSTLCTGLGAVVDLLEWRVKTGPDDTADDAKYADLMKCEYHGFQPIITKPSRSLSTFGVTPDLESVTRPNVPPGTRYYIPPAIALMAQVRQSELEGKQSIFSSDAHSPFTLRMVLSAFQNAGVKSFPPTFLFKNPSAELIKAFESKPLVSPFIVEEAADQNAIIINGVGLTIREDNTFYSDGTVSALVLLKRAYQMGYGNVEFVVPYDEPSNDDRYAVSEQIQAMFSDVAEALLHVHNMSVGEKTLTFQLKTRGQENTNRRRNLKTGHADAIVLASTSKSIIPEGVRITFLGKYELEDKNGENLAEVISKSTSDYDLSMEVSKDVSARVVGCQYSLEELLRASEEKVAASNDNEKGNASSNPNQLQLTAHISNNCITLSRFVHPLHYYIKVNGTMRGKTRVE